MFVDWTATIWQASQCSKVSVGRKSRVETPCHSMGNLHIFGVLRLRASDHNNEELH
jgi:hypothetical protein